MSMDIADSIAKILKHKGWTNKELAEKTGTTEEQVIEWLSGDYNFDIETITLIEAAFELAIVRILNE